MSRSSIVVLLLLFLVFPTLVGCKSRENNDEVNKTISEIVNKEEELKSIGVPSFITQEQAKLEEEKTNLTKPELYSMKETYTQELIAESRVEVTDRITMATTDETKVGIADEKIEIISKEKKITQPKGVETKKSKPSLTYEVTKGEVKYPSKTYSKVYFSYRNGYNYVSKDKPCKITTVIFASKNVWYVDYNIYAIPLGKLRNYKKYLVRNYLIGIGRNISVVEGRSQLTVYWTGINLNKKKLPKGKYIIVTSAHLKNMNKKPIGKTMKVLGGKKPLVVVLK